MHRLPIPFLPTRRFALVVFLLAPVWLLSGSEAGLGVAVGVSVLVAVAAVADALLTPGGRTVTVERRVPAMIGIAEDAAGAYVVRSAWPRALRVELYDLLPDAVERRFGRVDAERDGEGAGGEGGDKGREETGTMETGAMETGAVETGAVERAAAEAAAAEAPTGSAHQPWGPPSKHHDTGSAEFDGHHSSAEGSDRPPSIRRGGRRWIVPARGEAELPITLIGRRRGVFSLGPVALRVVGPFGVVVRTVRVAPGDSITVAPSVAGVRRYRLLALQHRLRDAGVRAIRRRGAGTNFAGLREYVEGDDPRHVDWKATARRGTLVSREFTVEQGQSVLIAIDAGRSMTQYAGPMPRFEYALSSALVLADVAASSGDHVGLLVFDDEVRAFVPPARGRAALQRIREALVPVQATMAEPDYAAAFRTLAARHRKRALLVLFTDVIDARASQAVIAHTTRGAVRHLPLVVALRNDALIAAADPAARTSAGIYAAAAAEELLSARADALERMRRAGVSVVDVSPQAMTAAVVNRYLEVKGRGAL